MSNGDEKHVQQSTGGRSDRGMESEWIECTLADVCSSIDYGFTASATIHNTGLKFLRITDIVTGHIDWSNVPYVDADSKATAKYRLNNGDIVIARTGASTGSSTYVMDPPTALFASYLVRLKISSEFDPRYVAYYLRSDQFWTFIQGVLGDKSAQPNASASTMTSAPFRAPRTIDEQRAIAHILGTLDDKIELNRRMNETLEAMARAIFTSWFVDFDPVRAKAEGRPTGLPEEIDALFPDSFEESELGEIPKGWEVNKFKEFVTPRSERVGDRDIIEYSSTNDGLFPRSEKFKKQLSKSKTNNKVIRENDIVFGLSRQILNFGLMKDSVGAVSPAYRVFTIEPNIIFSDFVERYMRERMDQYFKILGASSREGQSISVQQFYQTELLIPPRAIQKSYIEITCILYESLKSNCKESKKLTTLRDTLLPKLISGELPIPDAEKFIEEVGDE